MHCLYSYPDGNKAFNQALSQRPFDARKCEATVPHQKWQRKVCFLIASTFMKLTDGIH